MELPLNRAKSILLHLHQVSQTSGLNTMKTKTAIFVGLTLILRTTDPIGVMHNLLQSEENIQLTVQVMKVMMKKIFMKLIQLNEQTSEQLKPIKKSHMVLLRLDLISPVYQNV